MTKPITTILLWAFIYLLIAVVEGNANSFEWGLLSSIVFGSLCTIVVYVLKDFDL